MSQLKKLKKRLTKAQYLHRQHMIGMRGQQQNKTQDKDTPLRTRINVKSIFGR